MPEEPSNDRKASDRSFANDFIASLAKNLATTLAIGIAGFILQSLFLQRAQVSFADLGASNGRYTNVLMIDNYSFTALEGIQLGFEAQSIIAGSQSQDTQITVEKASSIEQSMTIAKVFPLRRFSVVLTTNAPLDQSKIRKIAGPIGVTIARSDQLTSPLISDLLVYIIFVYIPMAAILIYFSLRLRRTYGMITEDRERMISKTKELRTELDAAKASADEKLNAIIRCQAPRVSWR
ncbi:hypothetical protein ACVIHH_001825 [Bradyrhizobium sp. USDA 4518]|uniref:hypothetical protein n=1 Tax=Bradyrhizobium sp. USDA 3458 TaxID=2591461 RepID=UPI001144012A|nr:hypothetical protein [Bradyrhizobium sp. USDA 3458]